MEGGLVWCVSGVPEEEEEDGEGSCEWRGGWLVCIEIFRGCRWISGHSPPVSSLQTFCKYNPEERMEG